VYTVTSDLVAITEAFEPGSRVRQPTWACPARLTRTTHKNALKGAHNYEMSVRWK
jgi:hypothetical protein